MNQPANYDLIFNIYLTTFEKNKNSSPCAVFLLLLFFSRPWYQRFNLRNKVAYFFCFWLWDLAASSIDFHCMVTCIIYKNCLMLDVFFPLMYEESIQWFWYTFRSLEHNEFWVWSSWVLEYLFDTKGVFF